MRCPDCNKFVGNDTSADPEVNDLEVDSEGRVTGSVRIVTACDQCGTELAEATFDIDLDFSEALAEHLDESDKDVQHDLEVSSDDGTRTDRRQTHTPKGKMIKPRYQKQFYGAEVEVTVTCGCRTGKPGTKDAPWSCTMSWSDETQASGMDQLT